MYLHAAWLIQYDVHQPNLNLGKANGGREGDGACFYVGQCFQISLRLHACLRVREALSVSVRGEGEGLVMTVCMFVCVDRQGQQVGWGGGCLPDGDCRAN